MCHLWWNYKAQSFHKLKVAFNNAFRIMHNLPTYCSASEMFTVNRVADCKAVITNLVCTSFYDEIDDLKKFTCTLDIVK